MSMIRPDTGDSELNQATYGWKPESEIRFVVDEFDPSVIDGYANPQRIEQAYFPTPSHTSQRVRIINRDTAVLTKKTGWGETRSELEVEKIDPKLARIIHNELCVYPISKIRYSLVGGWSIDVYEHPADLVVAEYEGKDAVTQREHLPKWMIKAQEITNVATNADIARWTHEQTVGLLHCSIREMLRPIPRIVLVGGPGSGKSTLFQGLRRQLAGKVTFAPEPARILIDAVGYRFAFDDEVALNRFERDIYATHKLVAEIAEDEARRIGARAIISDRHQVDSLAYLGLDQERFERVCNTRLGYEYTRCALVLYCALPDRMVYEEYCMNDGVRSEGYDQARELDRRLRVAYAGFGDRVVEVPFCASKEERLRLVVQQLTNRLGFPQS